MLIFIGNFIKRLSTQILLRSRIFKCKFILLVTMQVNKSKLYWTLCSSIQKKYTYYFCRLQQMCLLVEQCVESVCANSAQIMEQPLQFALENTRLEIRPLLIGCQNATQICKSILDQNVGQTITHKVRAQQFNPLCTSCHRHE